ncbi:hypothetical protein ACHAXR_005886 [Thalassiosira sp. AJA248-18]
MADLSSSGMVQSFDQIRDKRRHKGYCDTCKVEPVKCFDIKKRMGGMIRERVPLTEPGKVFNGICLDCNPHMDPDGGRTRHQRKKSSANPHSQSLPIGTGYHHQSHDPQLSPRANHNRRPSRPLPPNRDGLGRHNSMPSTGPMRQAGFRDLAQSLRAESQEEDIYSNELQELENNYEKEEEQEEEPREYEEKEEYNIFGERVMVKKARSRRSGKSKSKENVYDHSPPRGKQSHDHHHHNSPQPLPYEEQAPDNFNYPSHSQQSPSRRNEYGNGNSPNQPSPPRQNNHRNGHHQTREIDERKLPSIPDLAPLSTNEGELRGSVSTQASEQSMDALAQLIAQHCAQNPEETVRFIPGNTTLLPNAELQLPDMPDDLSVLTPDTYFQGRNSLATVGTAQKSRRTQLSAISENNSEGRSSGSSGQQRSMTSHQIREPAVPTHAVAAPTQVESTLMSSAPHLMTLREIVGECTQVDADAEAIDVVTQALIHDNATSMSMDLALFCLTTLWVLARKSDENKRKIIFEDATFDVIIEAMQIYRERSAEIQTRACGVLWSLSMDSNDRKHVSQGGGCEAILSAMLMYMEEDALQVMALGAMKVLSFDNIGKATLRSRGALTIVADVMRKHIHNPTIQSEGCVILGNLAVDDASKSVTPVSDKDIEAVVNAILAHPDSLEVHEAACFTLMSLASSAINVELIRNNDMSRVSLELAFQKYPDEVGSNILTLLRRLKFEMMESK